MEKEYGCSKDDGCNTNVVSREFLKNNSELCEVVKGPVEVMHAEDTTVEKASEVILGAELCIGTHAYTSNWVAASFIYDVLLGMPWHVAINPKIEYSKRIVKVDSENLPL